jgi:hypothetical protein
MTKKFLTIFLLTTSSALADDVSLALANSYQALHATDSANGGVASCYYDYLNEQLAYANAQSAANIEAIRQSGIKLQNDLRKIQQESERAARRTEQQQADTRRRDFLKWQLELAIKLSQPK